MTRLADPQTVGALREWLDRHEGQGKAAHLRTVAAILGVHSRRVTEAVAFLAAEGYPVGSVAGIGIWRLANDEERSAAICPEVNRLRSIARKLRGLGRVAFAGRLEQLALDLEAQP